MEPFVGEIRTFAFDQIPRGWLPCEGQILTVMGNQALYSLIGNTYGGSSNVNFALPDLRGRVILAQGQNTVNSQNYEAGNKGGAEAVELAANQVPSHAHTVNVVSGSANAALVAGYAISAKTQVAALTNEDISTFVPTPKPTDVVMLNPATVSVVGGAAHENRMPYTALQVCIAVTGLYPTRP